MHTTRLLVLGLSLVSSAAFANPERPVRSFWAGAVPGPHVLLLYLSNSSPYTPPRYKTHGTSHSGWFASDVSISEDAGSGMRLFYYMGLCDCHVPAGTSYEYGVGLDEDGTTWDLSTTVYVGDAPPDSTECQSECAQADSIAADAATGDGATSGEATGRNGGCALAARGDAGTISLLLAAGLLALGPRRRR
jgi:hypothetical protein